MGKDIAVLDTRQISEMENSLNFANNFIFKNYLLDIKDKEIQNVPDSINDIEFRSSVRIFEVEKIVYNEKEETLEKLQSLYNAILHQDSSVFIILIGEKEHCKLYLGVKNNLKENSVTIASNTLQKSLLGNFPGIKLSNMVNSEITELVEKNIISNEKNYISCSTGIPSLKDKENKDKYTQGLEKYIEAMKGMEYTILLLADPISDMKMEEIVTGYHQLYSSLSLFEKNQTTLGLNESATLTEGLTETLTKSISKGISLSHGATHTKSSTKGSNTDTSGFVGMGAGATIGAILGGPVGAVVGVMAGKMFAGGLYSKNKSHTEAETTTDTKTKTETNTFSEGESKNKSNTQTTGSSQTIQLNSQNKAVKEMLKKIDEQLERIKTAKNLGMWNFGAYFVSDNYETSKIAANTYNSVMRGEDSGAEKSSIINWNNNDKEKLLSVKKYLSKFSHPIILLHNEPSLPLKEITPSSLITGKEITVALGLPRGSVPGLPVIKQAEFGREVHFLNEAENKKKLLVGKVFHLGKKEAVEVNLDLKSLTGHTFITGSTGSGKSNTIYTILDKALSENKKFLVIEPAKGEYKNVFGGRKDVLVFGTNPQFYPLLKLNPFKFPVEIHVLEHVDRLIEIFNASWPMYAAMPAVLKKAVERIYIKTGWDLKSSIYLGESITYPSFKDLLEELPEVISGSAYSEELKGNYIGALVTRVESLVNGITGMIFSKREMDNKVLFDENCIIDLSRIGSSETKSLLMGIIFLKLQEYRMTSNEMNQDLKHITVLEEAHNLLRKTSSSQSGEGANLQGKSVEMISNAIAEMRTYGEAFIIADQAPGLLDEAVIRNTNTKIIHRLPDQTDRELVGKAANLNEDQIIELSRLETGVAAVYQNNWLEPVLCKINFFNDMQAYSYQHDVKAQFDNDKKHRTELLHFLLQYRISENDRINLDEIEFNKLGDWIKQQDMSVENIKILIGSINNYIKKENVSIWDEEKFEVSSKIIGELIDIDNLFIRSNKSVDSLNEWTQAVKFDLKKYAEVQSEYELQLVQSVLREKTIREESFKNTYFTWVEHVRKGDIL